MNNPEDTKESILQDFHEVDQQVTDELDLILSLLREPLWPRTISTKATNGRQVRIWSKQEALAWFKAANFVDCRICAYPYQNEKIYSNRIDLVMIDLDLSNFVSRQALDKTLIKTRRKIKDVFGMKFETFVLWSGNGYHLYIPIESRYILEETSIFSKFDEPSKKFLRFAERYLSSGKADSNHFRNVSFQNCMLRIPGSYNSKCVAKNNGLLDKSTQIKVISQWNGRRFPIYSLIDTFYADLLDAKRIEHHRQVNANQRGQLTSPDYNKIQWIETGILHNALSDYRKYAIWRILSPYLLNVKKLPYEASYSVLKNWLDGCNKLRSVDFNINTKIKDGLRSAGKGYLPIGLQKLMIDNRKLYDLVLRNESVNLPN